MLRIVNAEKNGIDNNYEVRVPIFLGKWNTYLKFYERRKRELWKFLIESIRIFFNTFVMSWIDNNTSYRLVGEKVREINALIPKWYVLTCKRGEYYLEDKKLCHLICKYSETQVVKELSFGKVKKDLDGYIKGDGYMKAVEKFHDMIKNFCKYMYWYDCDFVWMDKLKLSKWDNVSTFCYNLMELENMYELKLRIAKYINQIR